MSDTDKHLHYLHELSGWKVESDDPDVRGWDVVDAQGRTIGKVDNLLVSKEAEKVRYLDVDVADDIIEEGHDPLAAQDDSAGVHEFINEDGETHLIIPIGMVRLDTENNKVISDDVNRDTFARTKRIAPHQPVTKDYEVQTLRTYRGKDVVGPNCRVDDEYYEREEFNNPSYLRR